MKKHHAQSFLAGTVLFLTVVFASCGGSDDKTTPEPPSTPAAKTFSVTSTTPLNKVSGIAIQSTISAVFSKAVNTTSINDSTFIVTGATGTVAGTVTYDETSRTATFTPDAPFAKIATYTASVTTGVKDADGNALGADYSWSFTTGPTIAGGEAHSLILKSDGSVWASGSNNYGQVSTELYAAGTTTQIAAPVQVNLTGPSVVSVAAGAYHNLALRNDGTVLAWGKNGEGQLGDGTHSSARGLGPVQVKDLSGVIALSANYHSLALKSGGTVWAWGQNGTGELGNGTTVHQYAPVQVSGLSSVIAIAAGYRFSIALKSDGTVWAWGENIYGQLGDGNGGAFGDHTTVPIQVTGLADVIAISAGEHHGIALKKDGTVWAWGRNDTSYECGIGTSGNVLVPVQVSSVSGIEAIAAGGEHNFALKNDGTAWAWGSDYYGQLGDNDSHSKATAVQVLVTAPALLSGGRYHSLALTSDGTLFTWGDNDNGQLGYEDASTNDARNLIPAEIGVF